MKYLKILAFIICFTNIDQSMADQKPLFHISCDATFYHADRFINLSVEKKSLSAPVVVDDPVLPWRGTSKFKMTFSNNQELQFFAQGSVRNSTWEDGSNTVYVDVLLIKHASDNTEIVLAEVDGTTDNLNAKWKVNAHAKNAIVDVFMTMNNPEIETATRKATKELGRTVDGQYAVLVDKGYIAEGLVVKSEIRCSIPRQ